MKDKILQVDDRIIGAFEALMINNRDSVKLQAHTGLSYIESINLAHKLRKAAEEEPVTFILKRFDDPVGVIVASTSEELAVKIKKAIMVEVYADTEGQFSARGDIDTLSWGETANITVEYVQDGSLINDSEFSLMKTIHY